MFSRIRSRFVPQKASVDSVVYIDKIDKFVNSDFFFTDNGLECNNFELLQRLKNEPELQEKVNEMIVVNDIQGFDLSTSDEDVLKNLDSRYNTLTSALKSVSSRIVELRKKEESQAS